MVDFGNIDFCVCMRDGDACCDCCLASFCPCIMYGMNYTKATGNHTGCCMPCCCHLVADCVVSGAASSGPSGPIQPIHLPLGCLLRATHRQAVANSSNHKENPCLSILVEAFCWGCSMAQVRTYLKTREAQFNTTSSVFGLIECRNTMTSDEAGVPLNSMNWK